MKVHCPFDEKEQPVDVSGGCKITKCEYHNSSKKFNCLILGLGKPENFSNSELAKHLKIPESEIETHLIRAKELIRIAMEIWQMQNNFEPIIETPAIRLLTCFFPGAKPAAVLHYFRQNPNLFRQLGISPPSPYYEELLG